MNRDEKIKELLSPSGGPWGCTKVDAKFVEFLGETLGKNFLNNYRQKCPHEWLTFITNFEKVKKAMKPGEKICLALPWGMANIYSEMHNGKKIEKMLKAAENVTFASGMIVIKYEKAKTFFEPVIEKISNHVTQLLRNNKLQGVQYILMVGGFSECELLQSAINEKFERNGTKVLIPSEAQLAIIKGAVLFGHRPEEITERVLAKTYGCAVDDVFDETKHDPSRKFRKVTGGVYCKNVFKRIIEKGESVSVGSEVKREFVTTYGREIVFRLFITDTPPVSRVEYIDDPGITLIGSVSITTKEACTLELTLKFGTTEIEVQAKNLKTQESSVTTIDFLS